MRRPCQPGSVVPSSCRLQQLSAWRASKVGAAPTFWGCGVREEPAPHPVGGSVPAWAGAAGEEPHSGTKGPHPGRPTDALGPLPRQGLSRSTPPQQARRMRQRQGCLERGRRAETPQTSTVALSGMTARTVNPPKQESWSVSPPPHPKSVGCLTHVQIFYETSIFICILKMCLVLCLQVPNHTFA